MAQDDNAKRLVEAKNLAKDQPQNAEAIYKDILAQGAGQSDASVRNYEDALTGLGALYRDQKRTSDLAHLVQEVQNVVSSFAKAKTQKLGTRLLPSPCSCPPSCR